MTSSKRADLGRCPPLLPWRITIAVLIALASFLPATAPTSAQPAPATPARAIGSLIVTQSRPAEGGTICVGDRVRFEAHVRWDLDFLLAGNVAGNSITGLTINSFSDNRLGTLGPASAPIRWPRGAAIFVFTAQRPGSAAIVFETTVNRRSIFGVEFGGTPLAASVPIRVEDCAYRVTTVSRWAVEGEARLVIRGHMANAGLAYDDEGRLRGTGDVRWEIEAGQVGDCIATATAPNSQVLLAGDVAGDNLIVGLDFNSALVRLVINCRGIGGPMQVELLPEPLTVTVPILGGGTRTSHDIVFPEPAAGDTTLYISRTVGR